MTVIEMRDELNKLIEEGNANDRLIVDTVNKHYESKNKIEIFKGTIVNLNYVDSNKFISDKWLEFDNETGKGLHPDYEFEDSQKKIDENFVSRAVKIFI